MPIVGVDCFFLTKGGVHTRKELEFSMTPEGETELEAARSSGDLVKYMFVRCFQHRAVFAYLVPQTASTRKTSLATSSSRTSSGLATRESL